MWVTNGAPYTDSDKSKFTSYFVVPLQTCEVVYVTFCFNGYFIALIF